MNFKYLKLGAFLAKIYSEKVSSARGFKLKLFTTACSLPKKTHEEFMGGRRIYVRSK